MQAYFRDLTKEDLHVLLPDFDDPRQDPTYKVPPIGPHFSPDDLILSPRATRGVKVMGTGQHSKKMLVSFSQCHSAQYLPLLTLNFT